MKLPEPTRSTVAEVYRWREIHADNGHRPHLGASLIGHPCNRFLWLTFRWARRQAFDGRMLRLFDRGKREEAVVLEELRWIGCEVHADDGGEQHRVSAVSGHFGGSMDAVVRGLPEAPATWHVLEIKTHNAKSFKELQAKGVEKSKPQHWAQMQVYMHLAKLKRAAYFAVNKDTDEIYFERIEHEAQAAEKLIDRAKAIVACSEPPVKVSEDPAWHECKYCHFHSLCHGTDAPEVNCRTCVYSTPERDGEARWSCRKYKIDLLVEDQRRGCEGHRVIPILLERFAEPIDSDGETVTYRNRLTGAEFVNGEGPDQVTSAEIHALADKRELGQERIEGTDAHTIRKEFPDARYSG